ncbi:MAG: hypothetical protein K2F87_04505, partial [Muribaculaceae bacterium]|nr:hypothetical protein [Muribaculaceae bacterium]
NRTDRYLCGLTVEIEYRDMSGRMLHRREVDLETDIPAGETRMVSIPALDRQKTMYYHRSRPPRNGGMPFDVDMTILAIRMPL